MVEGFVISDFERTKLESSCEEGVRLVSSDVKGKREEAGLLDSKSGTVGELVRASIVEEICVVGQTVVG